MAVRLFTTDAEALLKELKHQITTGAIKTWSVNATGDFTHVTSGNQWVDRARFRPSSQPDRLVLNIILQSGEKQRRAVYSVYHGRFIEMAIRHVPKLFTVAAATPFFTAQDTKLNK